jgi:V8-like Glu-specific endopeptidase
MKLLAAALLLIASYHSAWARIDVIYGEDNRLDVYANRNPLHAKLARSTAGMIGRNIFTKAASPLLFNLQGAPSLERGQNICASEAFSQQPIAANCSGFLVGPDLLVTAGHCYMVRDTPENNCKKFAWVFGFEMKSAEHDPTQNISMQDIYLCKEVVASQLDQTMDFAIIRLDRKVVGREPLKFRSQGKIPDRTPLVVIGHPTGLPTKISRGGKITFNAEPTRFATTLDTFHGNSGSAVFDEHTGMVQGILIMGKTDYQPSIPGNPNSCLTVNRCDNNAQNCSAGEDQGPVTQGEIVLRIETIAAAINQALKN